MSSQALAARQKDELEQSTARQTELQHAAVDREAAAQDLWVRLEAERRALVGERERGTRAAAQLAAALQQMEVCVISQGMSSGIWPCTHPASLLRCQQWQWPFMGTRLDVLYWARRIINLICSWNGALVLPC